MYNFTVIVHVLTIESNVCMIINPVAFMAVLRRANERVVLGKIGVFCSWRST